MKCLLFFFMFLMVACGDRDSATKDSVRERQELEQRVVGLNQVIKEMSDEINGLQSEIDALNGMLANCEKAEPARPLPAPSEPPSTLQPAEEDKQKRLLDYLENLDKRRK